VLDERDHPNQEAAMESPRKKPLTLDTLRVETFEAGGEMAEMPISITGIDSTCPCCDTRPDFCP
jgi:hypothetical protein